MKLDLKIKQHGTVLLLNSISDFLEECYIRKNGILARLHFLRFSVKTSDERYAKLNQEGMLNCNKK